MSYIYKITNKINGRFYIGKHTPSEKETFNKYYGSGVAIEKAIKKYGKENFTKEILEEIDNSKDREYLNKREQFWIKETNAYESELGYNLTPGGDTVFITKEFRNKSKEFRKTYVMSEETKRKISLAVKGKLKTEIHKKHLSESHHLKKTHVIIFENGDTVTTKDSVKKIAEKIGKTASELRRASEIGRFLNGIYLLDMQNFENTFNNKYRFSREKIFFDKIRNIVCSPVNYRAYRQHHMEEYKNECMYPFIEEYLNLRLEYVCKMKNILQKALENN